MLLTIDPGKNAGRAFWQGATLVGATVDTLVCVSQVPIETLVIEVPQVYPGASREDPNDLISVALNAGRWIQASGAAEVILVRPRQWKGTVPKGIHNARVLEQLTPAELALVPKGATRHNAIDAIGIGLWYLRMKGLR